MTITPSKETLEAVAEAIERVALTLPKASGRETTLLFAQAAFTAVMQSKEVPQWQPIETAPKPSGRVLLAAEGRTCYGHWYRTYERWEYDGYDFGNPKSQPTHWMPLPNPPTNEAEDE